VGYDFEPDPSEWDEFDVFVAGWVWSRVDEEGTTPAPRISMRSLSYWPAVEGLLERASRHGSPRLDWVRSEALFDTLTWLALHREHGIQRPQVWSEQPERRANGSTVSNGFGRGEIYLARVNQFRAANIRDSLEDLQPGFDVDDIAFASLSAGASISLDDEGLPARTSDQDGVVNAWMWGIPENAVDPEVSLSVALELVGVETQEHFASRNCWIPTNTAVDVSPGGRAGRYCQRAMAPALARLHRPLTVISPPSGVQLDTMVSRFERLWTVLFAQRGYRPEGGEGIDLDRISVIMERYVPEG